MNLIRSIGKRHYEIAGLWTKTGAVFGASAVGVFLYMTDWQAVLRYVPIYRSKFDREVPR